MHVVTVNDYLARRDSEWVGQVHKFLGLEVGLVQEGLDVSERPLTVGAGRGGTCRGRRALEASCLGVPGTRDPLGAVLCAQEGDGRRSR